MQHEEASPKTEKIMALRITAMKLKKMLIFPSKKEWQRKNMLDKLKLCFMLMVMLMGMKCMLITSS